MADGRTRANYALLDVMEHLGPDEEGLDVPWATFAGNRTAEQSFAVPAEPSEAYFALQAFDVGEYGHEVLVNGDPVSGFDLPPSPGWQYWMDAITGAELVEGENTLRVVRDRDTADGFVVGTVAVHWKEPVA